MKRKQRSKVEVVKRRGHAEHYDERKVYGSVYWAVRASHGSEKEAEKTAAKIARQVTTTIRKKKSMDSTEIHSLVTRALKKESKDAAYMYASHRDIS